MSPLLVTEFFGPVDREPEESIKILVCDLRHAGPVAASAEMLDLLSSQEMHTEHNFTPQVEVESLHQTECTGARAAEAGT